MVKHGAKNYRIFFIRILKKITMYYKLAGSDVFFVAKVNIFTRVKSSTSSTFYFDLAARSTFGALISLYTR